MGLRNFRGLNWLNLIVCLVFCWNSAFSGSALAFDKGFSMLRPPDPSASNNPDRNMIEALLQERDKMTIAQAYRADLGRFLEGGVITAGLVKVAEDKVNELLLKKGYINNYRISYDKSNIYFFITRSNSRVVEDTAKILPAIVDICVGILAQAGKGQELKAYSFAKQVDALNIEVAPALTSKELEGWAKLAFGNAPKASPAQKVASSQVTGERNVYFFDNKGSEGVQLIPSKQRKKLLGGKGAGMQEMAALGLPVPPGFTITAKTGLQYLKEGKLPEGLKGEIKENISRLEKATNKKFGDPDNPLLVSVRSGAEVSMPGMMDSVLNLGLNDDTVRGLAKKTNPRAAYDSYRRFIEAFGRIVLGIPDADEKFRNIIDEVKNEENIKVNPATDNELTFDALKNKIIPRYKTLVKEEIGKEFPNEPEVQLDLAIKAVFNSWNSDRAKVYRAMNKIPDDLGTACNIVAMVFGNTGPDSGTGVYFTRDNVTGKNEASGDFLPNAQGDDVVSGKFLTMKIGELEKIHPDIYKQLIDIGRKLEKEYGNMQDIEFTIEDGKLYILQCRSGKRTGMAAAKIATDMVKEGLITKEQAILQVPPTALAQLLYPHISPLATKEAIMAEGAAGTMGAASGAIVFDTKRVLELKKIDPKKKVILVRPETSPEDIEGMLKADAIVTARGGAVSHAAIICKSEGKIGVFGCADLEIDNKNKKISTKFWGLREGDIITVDATNKKIYAGEVSLISGGLTQEAKELLSWADEVRTLGVRANADTIEAVAKAREYGAKGIGLLRIEHWIQANKELQKLFQLWILSESDGDQQKYLRDMEVLLKKDMKEILKIMQGYPVVVRLLDPPLHEFLPQEGKIIEVLAKELNISTDELIKRKERLKEANPMLGNRGVRLGIMKKGLTAMQTEAIISAGCELVKDGIDAKPEIMIPVVAFSEELGHQDEIVKRVAKEVITAYDLTPEQLPYQFGTMIETPAAVINAAELAKKAEFFSFGTNDLTQTTLGMSRDDSGDFLEAYYSLGIIPISPFVTLRPEVVKLMYMAIKDGRQARKELEIGICGEHGRDPISIIFSHLLGLDYVSPSGDGVVTARLVGAQAQLELLKVARGGNAKDLTIAKIDPKLVTSEIWDAVEREVTKAKAKAAAELKSEPSRTAVSSNNPLIIPPAILSAPGLTQWKQIIQTKEYYESLLGLVSSGVNKKLIDDVFTVASDAKNKKVVLISLKVLLSDPSLILAAQSINQQINSHLGKLGSGANIDKNAYRLILLDDVGLQNIANVEKLFAQITKIANNDTGINIFAMVLPQKKIRGAENLIKQLEEVGVSRKSIAGILGAKEWVDALAQVEGVSKSVIKANVEATADKIALAANTLFGTVELIAKADTALADRLELLREETSITVKATAINNTKVADEIEAYRKQVEAAIRV